MEFDELMSGARVAQATTGRPLRAASSQATRAPVPWRRCATSFGRATNPGAGTWHRDWEQPEPILVEHTGAELLVASPGGFFGGVTAKTVLTATPRTRNRVLGDAMRSLRLAEREGIGVDRMVIELVRLGHAPPVFAERDGGVTVAMQGGEPVAEVLGAHAALPRDESMALIGRLARSQGTVRNRDVQDLLGLGRATHYVPADRVDAPNN